MRLTLASVTEGTSTSGAALSPTLTLGLGIPSGTDCATFATISASPALVPHVDGYGVAPGTYCVRIADNGSLTATSSFLIRMVYPNPPTINVGDDKNDQFDTTLAVGGSSSRTVIATKTGNVQVRLQSLGSTASRIGIGFGVAALRRDLRVHALDGDRAGRQLLAARRRRPVLSARLRRRHAHCADRLQYRHQLSVVRLEA